MSLKATRQRKSQTAENRRGRVDSLEQTVSSRPLSTFKGWRRRSRSCLITLVHPARILAYMQAVPRFSTGTMYYMDNLRSMRSHRSHKINALYARLQNLRIWFHRYYIPCSSSLSLFITFESFCLVYTPGESKCENGSTISYA